MKLILSTEEWKWTENIYIPSVPVYGDLCRMHWNSTSWCTYESARVSRSAAILFNGHSPIILRYASSKQFGDRLWSPCRAGDCIYEPRKYIILCNIIWFIRLFMYFISLICPSVYLAILFINPSVLTTVCPSIHLFVVLYEICNSLLEPAAWTVWTEAKLARRFLWLF
jgi:hypothetical protein